MSETELTTVTDADRRAVDEFWAVWADGDFFGFDAQDREAFARWRAAARAEERERCAQIVERYERAEYGRPPYPLAETIRNG